MDHLGVSRVRHGLKVPDNDDKNWRTVPSEDPCSVSIEPWILHVKYFVQK